MLTVSKVILRETNHLTVGEKISPNCCHRVVVSPQTARMKESK